MSKPTRNDLCPCGSGLKYKKCCLNKKGMTKHQVNVINQNAVSSLSSRFLGKKKQLDEQET